MITAATHAPAPQGALVRCARLVLLAAAGLILAPLVLHAVGGLDSSGELAYKSWAVPAAFVVAASSCLVRAALVREERWAWLVLGLAVGLSAAGQLYWAVWLEPYGEPPFPSVADVFWLALYPLAYAGLLIVARTRIGAFRAGLWLDGIVGGAVLGSILAALYVGQIVNGSGELDVFARAVALAYPLFDLVLIGLVIGVLSLTGWRPGTFWLLLGGGFLSIAVADGIYSASIADGETGTTVSTNAMWALGLLAIGLAAWVRPRRSEQEVDSWRVLVIPSGATVAAVTILAYGVAEDINLLAASLAALAVIMTIPRGYFTFREVRTLGRTRREAATDYLTGLGNRRALMSKLDDALERDEPRLLVLCDLDGFKAYNDHFGHSEGDLLLARLGRRLSAAVRGHGEAYRLGGDEFCVLADDERHVSRVLTAVEAALSERGEAFSIGCSSGQVRVPAEAADASAALRLADERMYAEKNSRPDAAKSQAARLAFGILDQVLPDLGSHTGGVAELALPLGRALGMEGTALDDLERAAMLHDIGKIAIPASVLEKPSPLDEEEWEFIRRHTIIGERMLAAAPSLRNVATIVRATHERMDGKGYPDGLAGEDIPLAARIIAVCDAFDAMAVSPRPYAVTLSQAEALAELERGVGTQFDAEVVAALVSRLAARNAA